MQKLLEKKRKNNKKKKRKGEVDGRERPSASLRLRPTRASWPNRPAHTPLGRRSPPSPVQPTEGARPRVAAGPPRRRREGIRPPRRLGPLASHSPTCPPSLSRPRARSALLSSRSAARAQSPPPSVVVAATGGPALADPVGELRRGRLRRLVASAGAGRHRSPHSSSSPSPATATSPLLHQHLCCS